MLSDKRLGSASVVLGLTVAGTIAATGTAAAASYNGACGSGYSVIDSMDPYDGHTFLTYNSSNGYNGYNCVVTVSDRPGTAMYLDARLRLSRNDTVWKSSEMDAGTYKYYAGPVYVYARNSCVDWGSEAGAHSHVRIQYDDHCG
ncbi:spore-associated protein A [Streptomyces sp. HMX87]|uniref:spore-associated protein A n=1 Tax=Streptomyces sp. HMX87 TaxID=3390849 RepID=UPI003A89EC0D